MSKTSKQTSRLFNKKSIIPEYMQAPPKSSMEAISILESWIGEENFSAALGFRMEGYGVPALHDAVSKFKAHRDSNGNAKEKFAGKYTYAEAEAAVEQFLLGAVKNFTMAESTLISDIIKLSFEGFRNTKISSTQNRMDGMNGTKEISVGEDRDDEFAENVRKRLGNK